MSVLLSSSRRRFMLEHPITWLAGWHLALPAAAVGVVTMLVLSSLQGGNFYDQRNLAWLWFLSTGATMLLLLTRSAIHARSTVLSQRQTRQWFASLGGVMALMIAQAPVAQAIDCLVLGGTERSLFWMDPTEMGIAVCAGLSFALGFVTLAVAHAHGGGPRWTVSFAVLGPLAVAVLSSLATGVLFHSPKSGLLLAGLLLLVPVYLAFRGAAVQWGGTLLSARDLTVMATGPLLASVMIFGVFVGDEYIEHIAGMHNDTAWAVVWASIAAVVTVSWTSLVFRLQPVRMPWARE